MTTEAEEIRAELNMRRGLRAEVVETLVKFDKSIRDLEKQLAEAEKPKLRHGDYGVSGNGSLFFVQGETVFWLNAGGVASSISPEQFGTAGRLGNLIDEIKALGEERTEWKLDREGLGVSLREGSHITHPVWLSGKYLTLSEAESLSLALRQIIATAKRRPPMSNTHPVPTEPEERFVCPNCDLDDFPEVTTECGCRVCKQCAIVCDDCGSIWCANCTFPKGELKLCRPCFDEREAAEEAAEADVAA